MNRRVRIALTEKIVTFTARGKRNDWHANGFIRIGGRTVTGYAYDGGGPNPTFYPHRKGLNYAVAYENTPLAWSA